MGFHQTIETEQPLRSVIGLIDPQFHAGNQRKSLSHPLTEYLMACRNLRNIQGRLQFRSFALDVLLEQRIIENIFQIIIGGVELQEQR